MQPDRDEGTYEVGYGRPPLATRFKKGKSGNPQGRPPREKFFDRVLSRVLDEKIAVNENGRHRKISKMGAIYKQLVNRAVQGDTQALQDVFRMLQTLDGYYDKLGTNDPPLAREPAAVFVLPHNGRDDLDFVQDPELNRRIAQVIRDWELEQQQNQNPANDNGDDTLSELKTA